ncbi:NADH-quinone oxidoreductase subunit A [Gordonia sp. NPDC058843]|uniref:NADH-quinone oxidoreductase subunit A n=1 Tax=Gordonia sp. NPDC058843 TaxID=3346648 RepID=UPI0036755A94
MNAYVPIMILGAIGVAFAVFSVFIGIAIGPKRYNRAKLEPYECGIEPVEQSLLYPSRSTAGGPVATGSVQRVPVKYYLTAMLFIIFDIEIVFLYPWAVAFDSLGWFGLMAMLLFILNVSVAYAYEWRRGGLSWD